MKINKNINISLIDASKNFSKVTEIADSNGQAIIFKDNKPKYILLDIDQNSQIEMSESEKIEYVGRKILKKAYQRFQRISEIVQQYVHIDKTQEIK